MSKQMVMDMPGTDNLTVIKALADASRLRLLQSVLEGPCCVEELAERFGLSASTVSFHLGKLEQAGLVRSRREQYYAMYEAVDGPLDMTLRALVRPPAADRAADRATERGRLEMYHRKVLTAFFEGGHLTRLPAQRKKRLIILAAFAAEFASGRVYDETEVNTVIGRRFDDYCTIRREMIDHGMMRRTGAKYRRLLPDAGAVALPAMGDDTSQDRNDTMERQKRKDIIRAYKEAERTAGIYRVRNLRTGRVLIGSDLNLHGSLNRHRFSLEHGAHMSGTLQQDWNTLGPDAFAFEIVETVKRTDAPDFDTERELKKLEQRWIETLRPFTDHCYNRNERIRVNVF
jgi:biotin operon repressor